MANRPRFLISLCGVVGVYSLIAWAVLAEGYGIRINRTSSLPHHIFFCKPVNELSKGMIVAIAHPKIDGLVAKVIAGVPGDIIQLKDNHVLVNEADCGQLKLTSASGMTYTPISEGSIADFFVMTPHHESFDSRYSEFGLVKRDWVQGELWPIY